ncbi:hypothetical protein LWI29_024733 [Acer saccharum]|uniref:Uncharacterized protein n=1 Tax=Acer saccharum TaxID=4024 RepID=A0AA39SCN6_ACESA|nr:hypothetical protein LWI29_024733 [Acer saccharum]
MAPKVNWNSRIIHFVNIIEDMRGEHGIQVLYTKAWRATQNDKHRVFGKPLESFQLMPSYLYMLEQANPVTILDEEIDKRCGEAGLDNKLAITFRGLKIDHEMQNSCNLGLVPRQRHVLLS